MFTHYRSRVLFLKKEDRGEADRLFTVYSEIFGKLEILARSIRKIRSKLRGGAELFYLSEIEFIQGRNYKTLTDAFLVDSFGSLRKDLARLALSYKISEVFGALIKGQEPDEKIWRLLAETFQKINYWKIESPLTEPLSGEKAKEKSNFFSPEIENCLPLRAGKLKIIYHYFLWNLFSLLGYGPELYDCLQCRKRMVLEKLYFSAGQGGIICQNCFKKVELDRRRGAEQALNKARFFLPSLPETEKEIDRATIKILRVILAKDWRIFSNLKIEESQTKLLSAVSDYYLSEVLRRVQ